MKQTILLLINGPNTANWPATLSAVVETIEATVLDQNICNSASSTEFTALLQLDKAPNGELIESTLTQFANRHQLNIEFKVISPLPVATSAQPDVYLLTVIGQQASATVLVDICSQIRQFTGQIEAIAGNDFATSIKCQQIRLQIRATQLADLQNALNDLSEQLRVDLFLQADDYWRTRRRLLCFDMDSTLINAEVIDELARRAGVGDEVAKITAQAMRGELDFTQSFKQRMALLQGLPESMLSEIAAKLPLMDGAELLFTQLRKLGYKTAILSGGFDYFARHLQTQLGIDFVYANSLEIEQGRLTGRALEPVVDGERKARLLAEIATQLTLKMEQVVAVGDGANDLPMLALAGLGVAFRAKPVVRQQADTAININGLQAVLCLLGHVPDSPSFSL